ncbi:choice-of-anchor L domain-containing protein [Flavobacterium sp. I3-2]|uniref:choice-of-anchor L domain-containing protein n=1 Tax=Flavobacterium sp. I3-2 TaxID=2748319 RepID=UPI0015A9FB67|nr:choice-of-anchor L domain-containing protein [Flavobacterium sp. I3-2]
MKRILLLFFLAISFFANAQVFQENFNSGIPSTWIITNNGVGLGQSWMNSPASLGNNTTVAAMVANETGTAANPVQDWLITPQVNLTGVTNPQLVFVGKTTPVGPNRNSVLKVMISTTGTAPSNFTHLQTFTESFSGATSPISPNANFNLKTLNLTGYANQNVYIAFVMENVGVGKSWIIDDVKFFNRCLDVTNIMVSNVDLDSGVVSWSNPGGAASFEIELVVGNNPPTGVPTHTSTTNSIELPLVVGLNYKAYVRAVCSGNTSDWLVSSPFTPKVPGSDCHSALNIASLPYTHSDTTANYGDDYNGAPGNSCGITGSYLNGDDVVYAFTPNENMEIEAELIPQDVFSGLFVYDSCANIGVTCVAGVANTNATIRQINNLSLTAGTTYYFVISTRAQPQPQSVQYTFNIQRIRCAEPINLTASNFSQTSAQLGWQNGTGNNATSWQIFVQNTADNLPVTSGTTVSSSTPVVNQLQNGTPLQPSTIYEYYVRASCGDGNFSTWAGPYTFNTLCAPLNLPFSEGFNSTSLSEICWNVINANNDTRLWDLNYTLTPFEGNQSASLNAIGSGTLPNDDFLVSPVFNFNGQYRLRYKYKLSSGTTPQNFAIKMSQNGGVSNSDFTTVLLADAGYSNTTYKEKIVYLPNFVGTGAISWHVQSNGVSRIFIDDVVVEPVPSCPEPYDVVNTSSTATNMVLDWQQFGTVASWDVVLVPAGIPFTGNTTGLTVFNTTTKPFTTPTLPSGTLYDVYVRSNCSGTNQSTWSIAGSGFTKAPNDECTTAVQVPVNPDTDCVVSVDGSLIGATNSNLGTVCSGTSNNDVWFQFTATQSVHILSLSNIVGNVTTLYTVLYSGQCGGGLNQMECNTFTNANSIVTYNNLMPGTTYYVKVYSLTVPAVTTYSVCVLSPLPPIRTSNTQYTVPQLVTDILINNPCAEVDNITWSTGSNTMGIGYFEKNNSSFTYDDGIILSSGNVLNAPGPKLAFAQAQGNSGGDASLNAFLQSQGLTGTSNNASVLEFDFKAITNQMSFNFLFASEEYGGFQCQFSDIFIFLLTDLATGVTTNIAVVPNTNIPISVYTVRDAQYNPPGAPTTCTSSNVQYFDRYFEGGDDAASLGAPINFHGQTVSMVAQSVVVPGNTYHIKLAIADYNDGSHDSAVFIEGGSFQFGTIDLGTDLTVEENNALCAAQSYELDSGVDLDQYTVQWLKDGDPIPGATNPVLVVTESGVYTIEATYIGSSCAVSDSILVEIYPIFIDDFAEPELLKVCHNGNKIIDLTVNEAVMLNGIPASDFSFQYYPSVSDLNDNTNVITNPQTFNADRAYQIYIKVKNLISGCEEVMSFPVEYITADEPMFIEDVIVCTSYQLPTLPEGQKYFTGPNGTGENLKENSYLAIGVHKIYILSQKDICFDETSFNVEVLNCSIPKGVSPNGDGLNDRFDLSFFNITKLQIFNRYGEEVYSHGPGYTNQWQGQNNSGKLLPSGTYFYTIITPFESLTGWVQLVQEQN